MGSTGEKNSFIEMLGRGKRARGKHAYEYGTHYGHLYRPSLGELGHVRDWHFNETGIMGHPGFLGVPKPGFRD